MSNLLFFFRNTLSNYPKDVPPSNKTQSDDIPEGQNTTWDKAYDAEQKLAFEMTQPQLEIELQRRLAETKSKLTPELNEFYEHIDLKEVKDNEQIRNLYFRLLNDLQWSDQKRQESWDNLKLAAKRLSWTLALCLLIFFIILLEYEKNSVFCFLLVSSAGALGAILSLLIRLYKNFDEREPRQIENFATVPYLATRGGIGILTALSAYMLVSSKCINIIPNIMGENHELTKIALIGIISGFSENAVPNILTKSISRPHKRG